MIERGIIAGLVTAVLWAMTALCFTAGGKRVGSLAVNMIRLVMGVALLAVRGRGIHGRLLPQATTPAWIWLSISGVVGMAICDLCLFESFLWIGPRVGTLTLAMSPPLAAVIGWALMGEDLSARGWAAMAIALGGVSWVVWERQVGPDGVPRGHPIRGLLLAIGAVVGQAVGFALSKYGMWELRDGVKVSTCEPFAAAQLRELAGLAAMVIFYFVIRAWGRTFKAMRDRRAMAYTSLGAVVGPFLGVGMSMVALKYAPVGIATTLMAMTPIAVIPMVVLIHREKVSLRAILGAVIAVAGVALLVMDSSGK